MLGTAHVVHKSIIFRGAQSFMNDMTEAANCLVRKPESALKMQIEIGKVVKNQRQAIMA
jgi:hypothetical protein